jgi:rare lipoprotein A
MQLRRAIKKARLLLLAIAGGGILIGADTPAERASYDEVGRASWYGAELGGRKTGNGETFNPEAITAAHRTLPMPSYVEVTNLDTGRTILVRINDRGPFNGDRIIDLSRGAAQQLNVVGQGHFPVRVRRVNPPEFERTALLNGGKAAERLPTPPALLNALRKKLGAMPVAVVLAKPPATSVQIKPLPSKTPAVVEATYFVQVGAFSTEARANSAAKQVGGSSQASGKYWRVRTGPYPSEAMAKAALGPVVAKGYRDARITR